MNKTKPCSVCGKVTDELLFNDKMLGIAICSEKCEHEYIDALTPDKKEQIRVLRYLDGEIKENRRFEKIGWIAASVGLLMIVVSFLATDTTSFIVGVFPLTGGAFSTSYFATRISKLVSMKKRIII